MIKYWANSKITLSNVNKIHFYWISNSDSDLAGFLNNCLPAHINLLAVNWLTNNNIGINAKFYISSLSKAAARTTKDIYFYSIDFSAEDLQTVVKAACKTERVVFHFCSIHCYSGMDFGADLKYNIKFLSFQFWGHMSHEVRTTDWKTDPSSFSNIVDAIGSSGLRTSLEKVSVYFNKSLSPSKIQEEFNLKGMSHISVGEECLEPLSS